MDNNILEKIYKATLKFLVPLTPDETFALISEEAIKLTKANHGSIFLVQDGELERVYATSPYYYNITPRKNGYTYSVFNTKKPLILSSGKIKKIHPEIQNFKAHTDIIVPLVYRNKSIGVLTVMSDKKLNFTPEDLKILMLFSPLACLAIRKTQLYDETRQALETRNQFISMAAHELRTPLTSINGYVQLLHSKLATTDTSEARWVEHLYSESIKMTNLINELLAVNKLKNGQLQYMWSECSLKEISEKAISNFKMTVPERTINVEDKLGENRALVIGDTDKLKQAINNLLDNATKFSPTNSEITVTLSSSKFNYLITIKDLGFGIKENEISKIEEEFYRGSNHNREGMGIGMFLVKSVIKEHKGSINIKSKPGIGTVVQLKLPKIIHE
jgi:signal transduction histidine kinase